MNSIFELTEIFATYKCSTCGTSVYKGQTQATFFPAHFVKECPNDKCPSRILPEPEEENESND